MLLIALSNSSYLTPLWRVPFMYFLVVVLLLQECLVWRFCLLWWTVWSILTCEACIQSGLQRCIQWCLTWFRFMVSPQDKVELVIFSNFTKKLLILHEITKILPKSYHLCVLLHVVHEWGIIGYAIDCTFKFITPRTTVAGTFRVFFFGSRPSFTRMSGVKILFVVMDCMVNTDLQSMYSKRTSSRIQWCLTWFHFMTSPQDKVELVIF
jgi:hypothetical protein